jgi:hypothetical protein
MIAQRENPGKGKGNDRSKNEKSVKHTSASNEKKEKAEHIRKVWAGTSARGGGGLKLSKNQPAKVRAAFQRDYPTAGNVTWYKYRGDWTASFRNGPFISTVLYHANGDRRDTRTPVTKNEMPGNILQSILHQRPAINLGDIIKIESPIVANDLFRVNDNINGKTVYYYYNWDGVQVKYNY